MTVPAIKTYEISLAGVSRLGKFIERVEELAFDIPPPNMFTPRFIELCTAARAELLLTTRQAANDITTHF